MTIEQFAAMTEPASRAGRKGIKAAAGWCYESELLAERWADAMVSLRPKPDTLADGENRMNASAIPEPEFIAGAQQLWFPRWFELHPDTCDFADSIIVDAAAVLPPGTIEKFREARLQLKEQARQAYVAGDSIGFLCCAPNTYSILMVENNVRLLKERGIYEKTLLDALTATRTNNRRTPLRALKELLLTADRGKLLAAGDPLPSPGPFTLYRGVAGKARDRRVRGISWTGTFQKAAWFADRGWGLANPEVYKVQVHAKHVFAYLHGSHRNEDEYVVILPRSAVVERVALVDEAAC